jgi:molybdopterin synthase catalytic subunit
MPIETVIHVELRPSPIEFESLQPLLSDPDVGAHGWFVGVTRRTTGDAITQTLHYEANQPMAITELKRLAGQAIEKFSLSRVVIVHRLGEVPIGQASVVVGCCSGHRPATFAALPWIMDELKRDVPIWKRETFANGSKQWVHPTDG